MTQWDFDIEGMTCGSCAARINHAIEATAGVDSVSINFAMRTGRVSGKITAEKIAQVVADAGYKAIFGRGISASGPINTSQFMAKRDMKIAVGIGFLVVLLENIPMLLPVPPFEFMSWLQAILATILIAGPARGFFTRSFKLLRHGGVNMDTLVAMGVGAAWIFSLRQMASGGQHLYFESAVMIAAFVLVGRWLEERARNSALDAIAGLAAMQPATAIVRRHVPNDPGMKTIDVEVPLADVAVGDLMVVPSGQSCPTDGIVEAGSTEIDESLVSGESVPVLKVVGSAVIGGTINCGSQLILVRAVKVGKDTMLARIVGMVQDAQASKPEIQKLVDAISARFVPGVIVVAAGTLLFHMNKGQDFGDALQACLAVLVIACPCALGLATPTAILAGTGRAARMGILIRDPDALQMMRKATALVIDKTGTVTTGTFEVPDVWWVSQVASELGTLLPAIIYGTQKSSRHPLAQAVAKHFARDMFKEKESPSIVGGIHVDESREIPGRGVIARLVADGKVFVVASGNESLMRDQKIDLSSAPKIPLNAQDGTEIAGGTIVWFSINGKLAGRAILTSTIRERAAQAVHRLMLEGMEVVMASGDREAAVAVVARAAGIGSYHAALMPEQKVRLIKSLQASGKIVVMAGDGINDAPALAQADVGIAVGRGTDIAIGTAGLIIPSGDLTRIADAVMLSRATARIIHQNLFWAFFYNTVAIPVAALGFLSPMLAAAAMALSSVSVVTNSLRLTRVRPGGRS